MPTPSVGDSLVSDFESSVEKFFEATHAVSALCGEDDKPQPDDVRRFASIVTFLKEWKYFHYEPKDVNLVWEDSVVTVSLPQFSSARIPRSNLAQEKESACGQPEDLNCDDFLLHAGGSVWALDWCPRGFQKTESQARHEYLAVSAHPPGSSYHKIGVPLTGRGVIQIWCIVNVNAEEEPLPRHNEVKSSSKKLKRPREPMVDGVYVERRGRPRKHPIAVKNSPNCDGEGVLPPPKRPRGRPRKQPGLQEHANRSNGNQNLNLAVVPFVSDLHLIGNSDSIPCPSKGNVVSDGDSMIRSETDTDLHVIKSSTLALEKSRHLPKKGRGRPKKILSSTELLESSKEFIVVVEQSIPAVGARNETRGNINGDSLVGSRKNTNLNKTLARPSRGRPKTTPIETGSSDSFGGTSLFPNARCTNDIGKNLSNAALVNDKIGEQPEGIRRSVRPKKRSEKQQLLDTLKPNNCVVPHVDCREYGSLLPSRGELPSMSVNSSAKEYDESFEVPTSSTCSVTEKQALLKPTDSVVCNSDNLEVPSAAETYDHSVMKHPNQQAALKTCISHETVKGEECEEYLQKFSIGCAPNGYLMKKPMTEKAGKVNAWATINVESRFHTDDTVTVGDGNPSNSDDPKIACERETKVGVFFHHHHNDTLMPRVVLCLAHMGKVAWDIKWRPNVSTDSKDRCRMGYLAAVLGNGSLEVWDVPLPSTVQSLYMSHSNEQIDPRFLRLKPIFRCTKLGRGQRQSIPLTLEWSPSPPHDLILVGCHDGTVAVWKFVAEDPCKDTKPLLCFTADNVPIGTVTWAPPHDCDIDSANVVLTAGQEGLKLWDIRDPFSPLWDFNPIQRHILSVDWLRSPRCIVLAFDDGAIRVLCLTKTASDVLVTGKPLGASKAGYHSYPRSAFAIWNIHVSRVTGQVAYCGVDGLTSHFQMTEKLVELERARYHPTHFVCGALVEEGHNLSINLRPSNCLLEDTSQRVDKIQSGSNLPKIASDDVEGQSLAMIPFTENTRNGSLNETEQKHVEIVSIQPQHMQDMVNGKEQGKVQSRVGNLECTKQKETFPSKKIAMHRVRWNMNRGSERWLCYGGAAGIIRCQQISRSEM